MNKVKLNGIYKLKKTGEEVKVVGYQVRNNVGQFEIVVTTQTDNWTYIVNVEDLEKIPEVWRPEEGDKYYYLYMANRGFGYESAICGEFGELDVQRLNVNRAFRTEKEAIEARDKVKELLVSLKK